MFLEIFKHLLPNARAWNITATKNLRNFFEGLTDLGDDIKQYFDDVWLSIFPETTTKLDEWEAQFNLNNSNLIESERRSVLSATWKALGGQSPSYIQNTLRNAGFDVYIHEWWIPGTEGAVGVKQCATPQNPLLWLDSGDNRNAAVDCGEPLAACGESFAESGNSLVLVGYPLVNKIYETNKGLIVLCGEPLAQAGEVNVDCGDFLSFSNELKKYIVPTDPTKWPYFLYIGGVNFGDVATVPADRQEEFETLCLKICPAQQWLGMLIEYV